MQSTKGWVLVIGILVIFAAIGVAIVQTLRSAATDTLAPITQANETMRTQVAQFLHPTPTVIPDPVTIIHDIRSLARLETIQYTVEKVITAQNAQGALGFLFGDKLIFVAHGSVIAGVDLQKLNPNDLTIQNGVLTVRLPPAEVFVATLDNEKSYVYDRQTGALTHGDTNLETTARRAAEEQIRETAIQDGILEQAQQNAESFLSRLLRELGYADVIFVQPTVTPGG